MAASRPLRVVVAGGAGAVGSEVVRALGPSGAEVVAASRRTGFDLVSGEGVVETIAGADVVVQCAMSPRRARAVELDGTRRMIDALRAGGKNAHLIYISIVGCDRIPYSYYRVKHETERLVEQSGLPATVVRATQFHSLVAAFAKAVGGRGPLALFPGLAFQPVETRWVGERLAELALAPAPPGYRRATDLGGPDRVELSEAIAAVRARAGKRPARLIRLPLLGGTLRAFGSGASLPGADAELGGCSFAEWLEP